MNIAELGSPFFCLQTSSPRNHQWRLAGISRRAPKDWRISFSMRCCKAGLGDEDGRGLQRCWFYGTCGNFLRTTYISTGWWFHPSEKYQSIGMVIPNIWENKKCSKPPTSSQYHVYQYINGYLLYVHRYIALFFNAMGKYCHI